MNFDMIWANGIANLYAFHSEYGVGGAWGWVIFIAAIVFCIAVPYFLGGLNFAIILSKAFYGDDIRRHGSGNAGTTNMLRTSGKKFALITLVGDMMKAAVATALGFIFLGVDGGYLAGLCCILGHMFPAMYKFKGGKGVACVLAMMLVSNWPVFFIIITLFFTIILTTKYVSLAAIICMTVYPWLVYQVDIWLPGYPDGGIYVVIALLIGLLIIFMHRTNINRLWNREESKTNLFKSSKSKDDKIKRHKEED